MDVRVNIEIGHEASIRNKRTPQGFTHDWEVFVRGSEGAEIHYFIEKVVFHLHESFPRSKRVVKDPPYAIKECGYAGFTFPIDIYLLNKYEPKKITFTYDLTLQQQGPPIYNVQKEKYIFTKPSEDFKSKLLRGGGVIVSSHDSGDNRSNFDEKGQLVNKPKLSGSDSAKKHKIKLDDMKNCNNFENLFGPPIKTSKMTESKPPSKESGKSSSSSMSSNKSEKEKDKNKVKYSPKDKDKDRERDKFKDKSDSDRKKDKDKDRNKDRNKERDRSKEKSTKRDKSPRPPSPRRSSPKRVLSPKRPSSSPKHKEKEEKRDKEIKEKEKRPEDKDKSEKKSKKDKRDKDREHKENKHKDKDMQKNEYKEHKKEQKLNKEIVKEQNSSPPPPILAPPPPPKEKKEKIKDKEAKEAKKDERELVEKPKEKDEKIKHKHKKKDKDRKEKKDEKDKSHKSEKKAEKEKNRELAKETLPPPKEDKTSSLFSSPKSEPEVKQKSVKPLNTLFSEIDNDSSNDSISSMENTFVEPLPPKPEIKPEPLFEPKKEVVEPELSPPIKIKKDKSKKKDKKADKDSEKRRKRKSSPIEIEEPPEKLPKDEPPGEIMSDNEQTPSIADDDKSEEYINILKDLQHKIMSLQDNSELQKVVQLIAETGRYEVSSRTFDFDLCLLERSTVQQLQEFFASTS